MPENVAAIVAAGFATWASDEGDATSVGRDVRTRPADLELALDASLPLGVRLLSRSLSANKHRQLRHDCQRAVRRRRALQRLALLYHTHSALRVVRQFRQHRFISLNIFKKIKIPRLKLFKRILAEKQEMSVNKIIPDRKFQALQISSTISNRMKNFAGMVGDASMASPFVDGAGGFSPAVGAAAFSPAYSPASGSYGQGFASGSYGQDSDGAAHSPMYSPTSPQYS